MKLRLALFTGVLGTALMAASGANANAILSGTMTVDNAFFAYVSNDNTTRGTLIGQGTDWTASYNVLSSTLTAGTWYLHIEAIDQGGPAGFSGVFNLNGTGLFANGTQTLTTDPANLSYWTGLYNNANGTNTEQAWVVPTGTVYQDTSYPWGNRAGTANWTWASDALSTPGGSQCSNCTVDFSAQFTVARSTDVVPEPLTLSVFGSGLAVLMAMRRRKSRS
jgi:hypothetical protein